MPYSVVPHVLTTVGIKCTVSRVVNVTGRPLPSSGSKNMHKEEAGTTRRQADKWPTITTSSASPACFCWFVWLNSSTLMIEAICSSETRSLRITWRYNPEVSTTHTKFRSYMFNELNADVLQELSCRCNNSTFYLLVFI